MRWAGVEGAGSGVECAGSGGRGSRDKINYLVKITTENKVFHDHFLRNWMLLSASGIYQIPFLTFISLGLAISFLCLSLSPSLFHMTTLPIVVLQR